MRTWAEVSLFRLAENYRKIAAVVGPGVVVVGVVKANAYGHGAVRVSRVLIEEGASWLAVSNVAEGVELRKAGIGARVLVMGGVFPCERELLFCEMLTPVVHSLEELAEFDALAKPLNVHFKIDTGMARLGARTDARHLADALQRLRHVHIEGLMSHLASPADPLQSAEQLACFQRISSAVHPEFVHVSSSFALNNPDARYNMVRPGIGLYGYAPAGEVKPVLTWKARVVAVKDLPRGAPIGYGARYHAPRAMRTAVIAVGYADGLPRSLTNRGHVFIAGGLAPIVGAVSMDLTTIDVTDLPSVKPSDEAEIMGDHITASDIAAATGTISYEILTGIGNRVERTYLD